MDYKEKLEEAKRLYETANADQKYVLESLFPELKESEDERIKSVFRELAENYLFWEKLELTKEKAIAWLKKQSEQKPAWSEKDEYVYNEILKRVADKKLYEHDLEYIYKWLKSLRPQNHWKPSDEQMEALK